MKDGIKDAAEGEEQTCLGPHGDSEEIVSFGIALAGCDSAQPLSRHGAERRRSTTVRSRKRCEGHRM